MTLRQQGSGEAANPVASFLARTREVEEAEEAWLDSTLRVVAPLDDLDETSGTGLWVDLWPVGYKRVKRRWLYEAGRDPVPGARDLTLDRLWSFPASRGIHLVSTELVRHDATLAFCSDHPIGVGALGEPAHEVPAAVWQAEASRVLGLIAPELLPGRLVNIEGAARLLRVQRQTISTYLVRGTIPEPQGRLGQSPLWAVPILWRHLRRAG